jgi:hypothetical protein
VSDRAPILARLERMIENVSEEIDRRGYQAEGLQLEIEQVDGDQHTFGKPVKPPSSNAEQLSRLGARMLGNITVGAPVTSLALTVYPLRPFHVGASQLTLFDTHTASTGSSPTFGHALQETLRRLWDRFGELSVLVASLVGAPAPSPIQVTTDPNNLPRAVVWRERIWEVHTIYEHWRERRRWWSRPIARDYFRVEIERGKTQPPGSSQSSKSKQETSPSPGRMQVIFRDVEANQWFVERRYV